MNQNLFTPIVNLTPEIKKEIVEAVTLYATKHYKVDHHVLILLKENTEINKEGSLLQTRWGQGSCFSSEGIDYNMFIKDRKLVGCVATAVGQIMKYHRFPGHFDWDSMPNDRPTAITAQFLADVAEGVNTRYGCGGFEHESLSTGEDAMFYLNSLGYQTRLISDSNGNEAKIVRAELRESRPILVGGGILGQSTGHAFILDGYTDKSYTYEIKVLSFPDAPPSYLKDENLYSIYSKEVCKGSTDSYHLNLGWGGERNSDYPFNNFLGFDFERQYIFITPLKK